MYHYYIVPFFQKNPFSTTPPTEKELLEEFKETINEKEAEEEEEEVVKQPVKSKEPKKSKKKKKKKKKVNFVGVCDTNAIFFVCETKYVVGEIIEVRDLTGGFAGEWRKAEIMSLTEPLQCQVVGFSGSNMRAFCTRARKTAFFLKSSCLKFFC